MYPHNVNPRFIIKNLFRSHFIDLEASHIQSSADRNVHTKMMKSGRFSTSVIDDSA
jgi:hypothetical protein